MRAFWTSTTGQLSLGLLLVAAFVLPIWWLVTIATGEPNDVLAVCCAIFGASSIVAVVVLARRG